MPTSGYCASGARAASRLCRACRGGRGDGAWGRWRLPAALCAGGSIVGTGDGRTGVPRIWLATTAVAPVSPCTSGRRVGYGVVAERAGLNCINYVCVCVAYRTRERASVPLGRSDARGGRAGTMGGRREAPSCPAPLGAGLALGDPFLLLALSFRATRSSSSIANKCNSPGSEPPPRLL